MIDHLLQDTKATMGVQFSDGDASSDVMVDITDAAGRAVGTQITASSAGNGRYTFSLDPQAELCSLTMKWSGEWSGKAQAVRTYAEIVGGLLFPISELRQVGGERSLKDEVKYSDEDLIAARGVTMDFFEKICGTSFVPRYMREILTRGETWLSKKRIQRLISIKIGETEGDPAAYEFSSAGKLYLPSTSQSVEVEYVYGWPQVPGMVSHASKVYTRYLLVTVDFTDRALSYQNELGIVRLSSPDEKYPTGLPAVDGVLNRYDATAPLEVS